MRIGTHTLHLHSIIVHFSIALYPAALFFLFLSFFYHPDFSRFAYFHLMVLATITVPLSHATGVVEWKQTYHGYRTRIFTHKIRYSMVVEGLGLLCILWYGLAPEVLDTAGALRIIFLLSNVAILPPIYYLGHLGGRLIFGSAH